MAHIVATWEAREYEHDPKSSDWYWVLGIIATASAIAAILFANYLVAVLIVIAAVVMSLHAAKYPPLHQFTLTDEGLLIGSTFHPFETMLDFSVFEDIEGKYPPTLSIKTESWHSPHLMIPLEGVDADLVYAHLLTHVDEGAHHPTLVDIVAALLKF